MSTIKSKNNIDRNDLKNNILQRIIFRVDYKGIVEIDTNTIKKIAKILPNIDEKKNDWQLEETYTREIDFELNDPEVIETKLVIPVKELNKLKSFKYSSQFYSTEISINKYFTAITIGTNAYRKFDFYNDLFSKVVHRIRQDNDFMRIIRIGLRKINAILINQLNSINNFFEEFSFKNISSKISLENVHFSRNESIDNFSKEYYNFNLIRVINEVLYNDEDVYQTVLDIDGYIKYDSILADIDSGDKLSKELNIINEFIFKIFKDNLQENFLNDLINASPNVNIIRGVNRNDKN